MSAQLWIAQFLQIVIFGYFLIWFPLLPFKEPGRNLPVLLWIMSFPKPQTVELPSTVKAGAVAEKLNGVTTRPLHIRDIEMVRLIGQYLCDKGYK